MLLPIDKLNGYVFKIEIFLSDAIRCDMNAAGFALSSRTIIRSLSGFELQARIPKKKPYSNQKQRTKRVKWAKDYIKWSEN